MEADGAIDLPPGLTAIRMTPELSTICSEFGITPCPKCDEPPTRIVPGRMVNGHVLNAELRCTCGFAWPTLNREVYR